MPQPIAAAARMFRRLCTRYYLLCAREELQLRGLQVPLGVWVCERCRLLLWDRASFLVHARAHATA